MAQAQNHVSSPNQSGNDVSVVVGDGWAALGAVGFLAQDGREIRWIAGGQSRLMAPCQSIEAGVGAWVWKELASRMGVPTGALQLGSWLREFRNRSFREPAWVHAPTLAARNEVKEEMLSGCENRMTGALEARFDSSLFEIEEQIRLKMASFPNVRRVEGVPLTAILAGPSGVRAIVLASGEEIACNRVIYADRWTDLGSIEGLPKPLDFVRGTESLGVLQASFTHRSPMAAGISETFFGALQREAGEESTRNVFGWFSPDGMSSQWSVCLTAEESENNHEIAKKLRRIKQSLEKMFGTSDWLPEGSKDWQSNVQDERVRFVETVLFASGKVPTAPIRLPQLAGVEFATDGFGPTEALAQIQRLLGTELSIEVEGVEAWISDGLGASSVVVTDATGVIRPQ